MQAIAKKQTEINQLLERIQNYLKPKQQKKQQELSKEDNIVKQEVPVWISGVIFHGMGSPKHIELSTDNLSKEQLERQIDKAVSAILNTYKNI
jgi:hypothetical protein